MAMIREDDGSYSYAPRCTSAVVGKFPDVPQPGDKAPMMHTPTADDVGGDLTKIDTRQPPSSMHDVDYADALGKKPVVLLFATPALCTSRVCGPVVDIAEEVKSERPDDAAYIHMEIYNDNDPNKGPRPQVNDFNLPSEPWLFVIDADGKVSTAIEGAFSKTELEDAIDKADAASGVDPPRPDADQRRGVRRPRLPAGRLPRLSSFCRPDSRALTALTRLSPGSRIRFAQPRCQCRCSVPPSRITVCAIT